MMRGRILVIAALAILAVAAVPLLGAWGLVVAAALFVLAAVMSGRGPVGVAVALVVFGGPAGAASALAALRNHTDDPNYAGRAWIGSVALIPGLVAATGRVLGINLYDINTLYVVALPACWRAEVVVRPAGG